MKKILLLFSTILFAFNLPAQNYDSDYYLRQAYSALEEGKIEVAQSSYNVYKKATGKTDVDFETLLKDAESKDAKKNDWKNNCFIVDMGNGYCIAGLKDCKYLVYEDAVQNCMYCRYGGFTDWRLPTKEEILMLLNYIPWDTTFWADEKYLVSRNGRITNKDGDYIGNYNFFPVRIFKK